MIYEQKIHYFQVFLKHIFLGTIITYRACNMCIISRTRFSNLVVWCTFFLSISKTHFLITFPMNSSNPPNLVNIPRTHVRAGASPTSLHVHRRQPALPRVLPVANYCIMSPYSIYVTRKEMKHPFMVYYST